MDFLTLVRRRHSVRSYQPRPVEDEKLQYIIECARLAPSAVNFQPWKFLVVKSPEARALLQACYPREWFKEAPLYVVVCANRDEAWVRKSDGKSHADIDAAIATEHICLAAADRGLGSCWVCNFDAALLSRSFQLPANIYPVAIVPVGYVDQPAAQQSTRKETGEVTEIV